MRPHKWQPTRLPRPWDSPGKNTGVGCHFLLQCMKGKSESEVTQLCPTLSDPMDCSLPGSSIHGIFQARVLKWGATAFSENVPNLCQNTWENLGQLPKESDMTRIYMKALEFIWFWKSALNSIFFPLNLNLNCIIFSFEEGENIGNCIKLCCLLC